MYIEDKSKGLSGPGRIGRVEFSKTGKSVYYAGRCFKSLKGQGFKANYYDAETGAEFWISGCKKRGGDRLYGGVIEIDEDVREEYWVAIRGMPECKHVKVIAQWNGMAGAEWFGRNGTEDGQDGVGVPGAWY